METITHYIWESLLESFLHVWTNLPILFLLYLILEWYGHSKGFDFSRHLKSKNYYAPLFGALLGLIPQCGISVLMTGVYLRGLISTGTLVAIYLSTSDEAIPVILSNLEHSEYIFLIVIIKLFSATVIGILVDLLFPNLTPVLKETKTDMVSIPVKIEPHHSAGKHDWHPAKIKMLVFHAAKHAINIFLYIFAFSFILFFLNNFIHTDDLVSGVQSTAGAEILLLTIIGLIPNCIASVAIAEGFLHYGLSFSAVVAGLSSAAGLGLILLIKESKIITYSKIIIIVLVSSIVIGFTVHFTSDFRIEPKPEHRNEQHDSHDHHGHSH